MLTTIVAPVKMPAGLSLLLVVNIGGLRPRSMFRGVRPALHSADSKLKLHPIKKATDESVHSSLMSDLVASSLPFSYTLYAGWSVLMSMTVLRSLECRNRLAGANEWGSPGIFVFARTGHLARLARGLCLVVTITYGTGFLAARSSKSRATTAGRTIRFAWICPGAWPVVVPLNCPSRAAFRTARPFAMFTASI